MGTNLNMNSCGNDPVGKVGLARQSSIYSLTFEQLQGSVGKEFGSMNMDELLKSIWSAEEIQSMPSSGPLQRQGSLTLLRTLSAKTVDEVWKDIAKEDGGGGEGGSNQPQKQQTLGEMTLEEFLLRAGVVKEDVQLGGAFGDSINTNGLGFGFQQMGSNQISLHSPNLPLSANGVRSNQQQFEPAQAQAQMQQQQQQLFAQVPLSSGGAQLASPGLWIMGFGAGATDSPGNQPSSDGIGRSNGDMSSVSPIPYVVNGGVRGRRCSGTVEKVVERRQKRMIKNRESAARSRARKQAYTMELEAEVAKLKEENEELRKKQEKILEMQKNQVVEMMNTQPGGKKQCLRRTQSGQW